MTFDDYASSFIPHKYTILGVELEDLSLGHYLMMRKFGSGFATDDEKVNVGFDDFVLSLFICSMPYKEFVELINNRKDGKKVRLWYAPWKYDNNYFLRVLKRKGDKLTKVVDDGKLTVDDIRDCMAKFTEYLKDGTQTPKYWEGEHQGKESGAHWSQTIFTTAISQLGYTREEALSVPLCQLFNDFFKYAESQGSIELMKESEEKQISEG